MVIPGETKNETKKMARKVRFHRRDPRRETSVLTPGRRYGIHKPHKPRWSCLSRGHVRPDICIKRSRYRPNNRRDRDTHTRTRCKRVYARICEYDYRVPRPHLDDDRRRTSDGLPSPAGTPTSAGRNVPRRYTGSDARVTRACASPSKICRYCFVKRGVCV